MSEPQLFLSGRVALHNGDSRDVLRKFADATFDSVACDPPYALVSIVKRFGGKGAAPANPASGAYARASAGFMGQQWDTGETAFAVEFWAEVFRVLKPGGYVVAFSGTRTYHRLAVAIEDAGFEIRDQGKFMHAGDSERDAFVASLSDEQRRQFVKLFVEDDSLGQLSWAYGTGFPKSLDVSKAIDKSAMAVREPIATDLAKQWEGWGTALKPAWEPIVLARKPLIGTVVENVLAHGTGAINIDGCRIEGLAGKAYTVKRPKPGASLNAEGGNWRPDDADAEVYHGQTKDGRHPANVMHDGSDEVLAAFPEAPGQQRAVTGAERAKRTVHTYGDFGASHVGMAPRGDCGSAARFFYSAKADADDRLGSGHPTVKPVDLMQWLVRLVTPKGGLTLDPFAGSGTTGEAAWREGMRAVLIEREATYCADIARRMALCLAGADERKRETLKAVIARGGKVAGKRVDAMQEALVL